jgi:hypothetical protein
MAVKMGGELKRRKDKTKKTLFITRKCDIFMITGGKKELQNCANKQLFKI